MNTTIYIIRHAKSVANDTGLFGGITDYHLCDEGVEQSKSLINTLSKINIDTIYSSPLSRAIQTITPTANKLNKPIIIEDNFKEINVGAWENIMRNELRKLYPDINNKIDETQYFTGIEGQEETEFVANRMLKAMQKTADENAGKNIVVVSHIVAIRAFLCKIQNIPFEETKSKIGNIPNTGITTIEYNTETKKFAVSNIGKLVI